MSDEKYLKLTDTELERMLVVAHQAGMEIGKERDWQKEGPTYPNFSIHAARALIKHERQHFEERNEANEARDFVINKELAVWSVFKVRQRLGIQYDKTEYANMTAPEIFQDLIAPTTEDNDDE